MPKENIFILQSGDVLELDEESAEVAGRVPVGNIMVDGLGVGDVGNVVLRDRQHLAENGIIIVAIALERGSNQIVSGPDIISRGFVYVRESDELMCEAESVVISTLDKCQDKGITDWGRMRSNIRDELADFICKKTKRRPMIMPIIMEI